MASKNDLTLKNLKFKVDNIVDQVKKNNSFMKSLADQIGNQIRLRARLGKDINNKPFHQLEKSYIAQRKGQIRFFKNKTKKTYAVKWNKRPSKLSKETTPSKSNLTATGLMLNSIRKRVSGGIIIIDLYNRTGANIFGENSSVTTNEKANHQAKAGRKFMGLAKFEQKMFADIVRKEILLVLKK